MSDSDSTVTRIAPTFTRVYGHWYWPRPDSELGITKARWDQYRALFDTLGLHAGLERDAPPNSRPIRDRTITFTASTLGLSIRGSGKGYAFSRHSLAPVFSSLNDESAVRHGADHGDAYRLITPNWYLEYNW